MEPFVLDGKKLSKLYENQIRLEVEKLISDGRRVPGLGVILVGDNPASKAYVANKGKFAKRVGFHTVQIDLAANATYEEVEGAIQQLNKQNDIDGILLQLPLPSHLDSAKLLDVIDPRKDADGLHPVNQGLLMKGKAFAKPCTPRGCMALLDYYYWSERKEGEAPPAADLSGKIAAVVGRSILVGKPLSLLLLERNATVIATHSRTKDIETVTRQADIVIAASGVPHLVKKGWVKEGAVVIDVGINRLSDGSLTGDVAYDEVSEVASAITPVPGGVGPMTVAMLMANTLELRLKRI